MRTRLAESPEPQCVAESMVRSTDLASPFAASEAALDCQEDGGMDYDAATNALLRIIASRSALKPQAPWDSARVLEVEIEWKRLLAEVEAAARDEAGR